MDYEHVSKTLLDPSAGYTVRGITYPVGNTRLFVCLEITGPIDPRHLAWCLIDRSEHTDTSVQGLEEYLQELYALLVIKASQDLGITIEFTNI